MITAIDSLFLSMTIFSAFGTVISLAGSVLGCMGTCCARTQVVKFDRYIFLSLIIFSCSVISFPADLACELPSSLTLQDKFLHSREIVCRGEGSARDRTMKMSGSLPVSSLVRKTRVLQTTSDFGRLCIKRIAAAPHAPVNTSHGNLRDREKNERVKFLRKLWCCVGGEA